MNAGTAVDGKSLFSEQAAGRALGWGSDLQGWITAHNLEIGFTSNPDEQFQTSGHGLMTITRMGAALTDVGYTGPYDRGSLIGAWARTTGDTVLPYSPAPVQPTGDGRGGHINEVIRQATPPSGTGSTTAATPSTPVIAGLGIVGNPSQWLSQPHSVLGVPVPGYLLAGGALFGLMSLRRHR